MIFSGIFKRRKEIKRILKERNAELKKEEQKQLKRYLKQKQQERDKEFKKYKDLSSLKYSTKILMEEFLSDDYFLNKNKNIHWYNIIKIIKKKILKEYWVLCCIHCYDNYDIVRYFKAKGNLITIGKSKYLFNPENFRYINGTPILYFMQQNPFAILMNPKENYYEPTITTESFATLLDSKFVQDSLKSDIQQKNLLIIIMLFLVFISLIIGIINLVVSLKLNKVVTG